MVDFELDLRLLAARDPGADLVDVVPVGKGPVYLLDYASDPPVEVLDADDVLDVVVAAERRIAAAHAVQMRALARFARLRPSGDPDNVMSEFAADEVAPALRLVGVVPRFGWTLLPR